jgi:hypothetical protein
VDDKQAAELAEATNHWVAFKHLSGFDKLIGDYAQTIQPDLNRYTDKPLTAGKRFRAD